MKSLQLLLLALTLATAAEAQDAPAPGTPPPPAVPVPSPPVFPKAVPVEPETVKPALPAASLPSDQPPSFTQAQVLEIETALKKQMMLVGMGSGVAGLLLGMMIGRKTAPRATSRRF
jgi:hypothetical protein